MRDYVQRGQVEVVDTEERQGRTFYLPHHAVLKGTLGETKWRIVFDASSNEKGTFTLNDALDMRPNLLPEVFAMLLRFRLHSVALIGEIQQALL